MSRNIHLKTVSIETMNIIEQGCYVSPHGKWVDLTEALKVQDSANIFYGANQEILSRSSRVGRMQVTVCEEDAVSAIVRMGDRPEPVCCLVFASARNPGGGFLSGAQAQEESIARCSTLAKSLIASTEFYTSHRISNDLRYSDAAIYTPHAWVIRNNSLRLLKKPIECAFITAAAPNRSAVAVNQASTLTTIPRLFAQRVRRVLRIARYHGHRRLVLGAWGCGVFGNDPNLVASLFKAELIEQNIFDEVVFAIPKGRSDHHTIFSAHLDTFSTP